MYQHSTPGVMPFFMNEGWKTVGVKEIKKELQAAITQDPEIQSKASISVDVVLKGVGGKEVHLIGSVADDREKHRAREIVQVNTKDEVDIVDELTVSSS